MTSPNGGNATLWLPDGTSYTVGQKAADLDALNRSAVGDAVPSTPQSAAILPRGFFLWALAAAADQFSPWGRAPKMRDAQLRQFWHTENFLSGATATVAARNAALSWRITGDERTAEAGTDLLQNANFGAGWEDFAIRLSLDLYCLAATSRIALGGERRGKTKAIREIVAERDPGPVITVGPDGRLAERRINEWHRTPLGDRYWMWVTTEVSGHSRNARGGLYLTNDHPVLTPDGWLPSEYLRPGMTIASGDPEPNAEQAALLVGMMLGDGSLSRGPRPMLRMTHNGSQIEWLRLKCNALAGWGWTPEQHHGNAYSVNSHRSGGLRRWRAEWYGNRKRVARDMVEAHFGPEMLAAWYGDDGSLARSFSPNGTETRPGAFLSTQGFDDDDVEWLARLLTQRGFPATTHRVRWRTGNGLRIYLGTDGAAHLFQVVAPYLPKSLRHKLPEGSAPYDAGRWQMGSAIPHFTRVVEARPRSYMNGRYESKTTYHIGVEETRNFVAANLVVHNTQDHGAFVELIRAGDRETSPVIGIATLDSARCYPTGNPEVPVIYQDANSRYHQLKWFQVVQLLEMPAPITPETTGYFMRLQYSAITRVLRAAQIIKSIGVYNEEKISGRFEQVVHLVSGANSDEIRDAMNRRRVESDMAGLQRYTLPPIVTTIRPDANLKHEVVELASLPDGWDEEKSFKWYINALALGFLTDYQEFAPLPGGNLGTSAQSEVLHQKSRGKGPALWQNLIGRLMNMHGVLPGNVEFGWDEPDIEAEQQEAEVRKTRAEARQIDVQSGVLTVQAAQQSALDSGDISQEVFEMMLGGTDVTPEVTIEGEDRTDVRSITTLSPQGEIAQVKARRPIRLGELLTSRLHRAYSATADDASALGYFDRLDDRLSVANSIGPALATFEELLREAGVWDIEISPEDADLIFEASVKSLVEGMKADGEDEDRAGPEDARLDFEREVADEVGRGLAEARRLLRRRLRAEA